jgi:hypothetical protein
VGVLISRRQAGRTRRNLARHWRRCGGYSGKSVNRPPSVALAELDRLFLEPMDLSVLGDPSVPIEAQYECLKHAEEIEKARWDFFRDEYPPNPSTVQQCIEEVVRCGEETAILVLLETLTHRKPTMRLTAAMGLNAIFAAPERASIAPALVTNILLEQLPLEKDNHVQIAMIALLGTFKETRAVEPLIAFAQSPPLSDMNPPAPASALEMMTKMRRTLEGETYSPRDAAVHSLGQIGDRRAVAPLLRLIDTDLSNERGGFYAHSHAAQILQEWEVIEAIEPMQRCLQRYGNSTDAVISNLKKYVSPELTTAIAHLVKLREKDKK